MFGGSEDLRGRRVLLVEDESVIVIMLEDILAGLGCEVAGVAMRPEAGIAILARGGVDAALLDVNLGDGRTSYPVAEALAARGVPFAFLTGYGAANVPAEHRDRPVLSKPVDERRIEAALREMLAAPVQER